MRLAAVLYWLGVVVILAVIAYPVGLAIDWMGIDATRLGVQFGIGVEVGIAASRVWCRRFRAADEREGSK